MMKGPATNGEFYHATPTRNDWDNPTREQLVKSVNDGHDANRKLEAEMGRLRAQLFVSNIKNFLLMAFVGGLAAKGIEVSVTTLFKLFAH